MLNSIGMGETLLRLIEKRHRTDAWVTYGGMLLVTLLVALAMWIFWR
jgi:golgi SNAP receptor complex member 2